MAEVADPAREPSPRELLDEAVRLHQAGQFRASIPFYIRAVRKDIRVAQAEGRPVDPDVLHAAGVALAMGGKRHEAVEFLEAAIANGKMNSGAVWSALGLAYVELRTLGKAERCYRRAVQLDPLSVANWTGFANLASAGGARDIAERRYRRALECQARDAEELIAQGMSELRYGHWRRGWRNYEARRLTAMWAEANPHAAPLAAEKDFPWYTWWNRPPVGAHVYVVSEQGLGDTVQFARYVPELMRQSGCRVTLQAHDALVDLLRPALPNVVVTGRKEPRPADTTGWALLLSLPAILRCANAREVPPPIRPFGETWTAPDHAGPPRIFVHAHGNVAHGYDFDRSAPGTIVEDMIHAAGCEVVTAGFGDAATAGETYKVQSVPSWRETVDLLLTCDRCVTVDTGLAHVAGSLGMPVELCVSCIPEWRWGKPDAERTVWYPTARLWHRRRTEQWAEMLGRLIHSWEEHLWHASCGRSAIV